MLWRNLTCNGWSPSGQPEHVAGSWPAYMVGPPQAGSALATPPEHPWPPRSNSAPEGCVCPSSVSLCDSCKGFCQGLCAAKAQIPSGWEQPGFPLLPAFLLLVMQMTSPHDPGTMLRKCWWCKSKWDVPEVLYLIWCLQGHRLLHTMCLPSPEDQGVTSDKTMLKWCLFLPSPEPPSGSHQSRRCDSSGTCSWVIIWGHIAKLSSGLTKSVIR